MLDNPRNIPPQSNKNQNTIAYKQARAFAGEAATNDHNRKQAHGLSCWWLYVCYGIFGTVL